MQKQIDLALIRIDCGTQSRVDIDQQTVSAYVELVKEGTVFPPVTVYFDGNHHYLADGFHRYFAHKGAGHDEILATVINGTLRDAVLASLEANSTHGLPRTNADKRKAVQMMLDDFEWSEWSNAEIARRCRVSHTFVNKMRPADGGAKKHIRGGKEVERVEGKQKPVDAKAPVEPKQPKEPTSEPKQQPSDYTQEDEALKYLTEENQRLADRLAVAAIDATEEEKSLAAETIEELREQVKMLELELESVKRSRDIFQSECNELKKQCLAQQRQLKKLQSTSA
jgi:ParB-like chromosome segregation protein Spo0J